MLAIFASDELTKNYESVDELYYYSKIKQRTENVSKYNARTQDVS